MSSTARRHAITFVLSQVGWFACILGAAHGWLWLGPLTVGGLAILFIAGADHKRRALIRLTVVGSMGIVTDSGLMAAGALVFPDTVQVLPNLPGPPAWMVALWVGFGTTLDGTLRPLRARRGVAVLVGALFGTLGYRAGVGLGAAELGPSAIQSLACIALAWGLVLPLLLTLDAALDDTPQRPPT